MTTASLPKDGNNFPYQLSPSKVALAQTVNSTLSSSQQITFNASTTIVRFYAISQDVYLKWGTSAVTSSNFDEVIPVGQIVDLIVPKQTSGALFTACNLIERQASATIIEIEK